MDMASIISENQRTRIVLSDSTRLFKLRNTGIGDVTENGRIGNLGFCSSPETLKDLVKTVRINLSRTERDSQKFRENRKMLKDSLNRVEIQCGILVDPDVIHFPSIVKFLRMAARIPDAGV